MRFSPEYTSFSLTLSRMASVIEERKKIKHNKIGNKDSAVDEPLEDAYLDVSNYGIMATIVKNRKWGK